MNYQKEIAKALLDIDAVGFVTEPIKFKSGMLAPVYTDNRKFPSYPEHWRKVIDGFVSVIEENNIDFDIIAGVEAAGIPHGAALGYNLMKPSVFVRKQAKDHGTKKMVEGGEIEGKKVLLIEDLVTTGGSSLRSIEALRNEGATATDCLVIVNYGFPESVEAYRKSGTKLHELTPFSIILDEAIVRGLLNADTRRNVESWLADPWKWTREKE